MERQLVYNAVKCLECGQIIESMSSHDYNTCTCPNMAMVDGGLSYGRYGAKDMRMIEKIDIYADDDYEVVRQYATRGSRGINNKQPLIYIKLCDMDNNHLIAVINYGAPEWHKNLILKEIAYRNVCMECELDSGHHKMSCSSRYNIKGDEI